MKIIEHKIKTLKRWAVYCMETIGKNRGQYFLIIVVTDRSSAIGSRDKRRRYNPDLKFKIKQVSITPL